MFSDDMCQIDAGMADQQFHTNPPILQANETCEIGKNHAYKNYEYSFAISPNVNPKKEDFYTTTTTKVEESPPRTRNITIIGLLLAL